MIGRLSGLLAEVRPDRVIVETGGIGWELQIPMSTFSLLPPSGKPVALHVYTHVREDAIQLFGFLSAEERRLFEKLLAVSGIGPKVALGILSGLPVPDFVHAVTVKNIPLLCTIPGVGRKLAERLALELKDRVAGMGTGPESRVSSGPVQGEAARDATDALVNLGYKPPQAEAAVAAALKSTPSGDLQSLLQAALRSLAK